MGLGMEVASPDILSRPPQDLKRGVFTLEVMLDMRRSFFRMQPGSKRYFTQWMVDVWRNQFLFWAIIAGFVTIFPTLYIPVINHDVFKHTGISWEWGIVFVEALLFFL